MSDGVPEATTQRGERIFLEIVPGEQPGVPVSRGAAAALSRGRQPTEGRRHCGRARNFFPPREELPIGGGASSGPAGSASAGTARGSSKPSAHEGRAPLIGRGGARNFFPPRPARRLWSAAGDGVPSRSEISAFQEIPPGQQPGVPVSRRGRKPMEPPQSPGKAASE